MIQLERSVEKQHEKIAIERWSEEGGGKRLISASSRLLKWSVSDPSVVLSSL